MLGEAFEQLTLTLGTDDEGPVVATLVRSLPPWRLRPRPLHARALETAADPDDPVTVNLDRRPELSWPVRAAWLDAILTGHNLVAAGLEIAAPVCVLLSARSAPPLRWSADLTNVDSVLVVDDIARAALRLGSSVTIERVDGALHDVFLSRKAPREDAYRRLDRWARGCLAPRL